MLDDDTLLLADLGIVNGDLIHVLPTRNAQQHGNVPGNQNTGFPTNQRLPQHFHVMECAGGSEQVILLCFLTHTTLRSVRTP